MDPTGTGVSNGNRKDNEEAQRSKDNEEAQRSKDNEEAQRSKDSEEDLLGRRGEGRNDDG